MARNSSVKARTTHRYPKLLHDFSFALGYLGTGRGHDFFTHTLPGVLPQRSYAMHKRLHAADLLLGPGFYPSRFKQAHAFYQQLTTHHTSTLPPPTPLRFASSSPCGARTIDCSVSAPCTLSLLARRCRRSCTR